MDPLDTNLDHVLQGGYFHPLLRNWQERDTMVMPETLVYPVFVTDDPDAEEEIPSLPGEFHFCGRYSPHPHYQTFRLYLEKIFTF